MFNKKNNLLIMYVVLGILFCVGIVLPYFNSGFFPTHDGEWAVVRAAEMFRELRDFQFPPRYSGSLNFGYGYPLFNFAYPFPYYVTTVFHALNFGFVDSVKAVFVLSVFTSFFGMFLVSSYFWKNKFAGFLSATLYLFLPYRIVDLYVRGSIGESVAFALYPLILFSMLLILNTKKRHIGVFGTALGIGVVALTHNISAVYFGIIALAFILALLLSKKYKESLYILLSLGWGGVVSSFFIIPALYEKQYVRLSKIPIADRNLYFVALPKILFPSWGYGTPTDSNPFTYNLGISQIFGFIASFFALLKFKDFNRMLFVCFLGLTILLIILMFPFSSLIWNMPLLSEINYPWTLLLPLGFLMSFLSGAVIYVKFGNIIRIVLILLAIIFVIPYAKPESYVNRGEEYYITNEATTTSSQELMPLWVRELPSIRYEDKVVGGPVISNLIYSSNNISFSINSSESGMVSINQIYYPGWNAYINERKSEISYNNPSGTMSINLPPGESLVSLKFSETKFRGFFDIVSLVAFVGLMVYGASAIWKVKTSGSSKKLKKK